MLVMLPYRVAFCWLTWAEAWIMWGGEKMRNGLHYEFHRNVAVFTPPRSLLINQFLQPQMAAPCSPRGRSLTGAAPRPWAAPRVLQSWDTAQLLLQRAGRKGTAVLDCRTVQFQPLSGVRECALKQEPGNRLCCACQHEQAPVTRPYCSISTCRESGSKISPATQFSRIKWTQGLISPPTGRASFFMKWRDSISEIC